MVQPCLHPRSTVACLVSLFTVSAFAFSAQQPQQLNNLTDSELKEVVIQLQRSTCYGNCPGYSLKVFGDGRVEYVGDKFVKTTGKREGNVDPSVIKQLLAEFERAGFLTMKQYPERDCKCTLCTDMPTVTTASQRSVWESPRLPAETW